MEKNKKRKDSEEDDDGNESDVLNEIDTFLIDDEEL